MTVERCFGENGMHCLVNIACQLYANTAMLINAQCMCVDHTLAQCHSACAYPFVPFS